MISRKKRILFFIFFLLFFLISAPLLVSYTAGYRFHVPTRQFIKTGILSISSFPKNATVFLQEKKEGPTPLFLQHLFPGDYVVRLEKNEYIPWEKRLQVKGNTTTFAENIVLFLKTLPQPIFRQKESFLFHPLTKIVLTLKEQASWLEVWKTSFSQTYPTILLRLPASAKDQLHFSWSANGSFLFIKQDGSVPSWILIDLKTNKQIVLPKTLAIQHMYWDPDLDAILYIASANGLQKMQVEQGVLSEAFPEISLGIERENQWLFLKKMETGLGLYRKDKNQISEELLATVPQGTYLFQSAPASFVLLEEQQTHRFFLLDTKGTDLPLLLSVNTNYPVWNPQNPLELLYATGFELHIYHADTHTDELLTRLSNPVEKAHWYPKGQVVLYQEGNKIYSLERDQRDKRIVFLLAEMEEITDFWIDENGKSLFLVGTQDGKTGLFERKLQK